jgi:CHASE2 domain-containing sensor protein
MSNCPLDGARLDVAFSGPLLVDGKYRIERCLGKGGMGAVYLAKHTLLEKYFALKVISTGGPIPEVYRRNFDNEALALGRLKHPNIVEVTDYGVDPRRGGLPYLVLEHLEGRTMRDLLLERRWLTFPEAVAFLRAIAAAIDCAHLNRIIHGDLKPGNLFLARQPDGSEMVKVVDFGLARLGSSDQNTDSTQQSRVSNAICGTLPYMAPELFQGGELSHQSDRFAFGVLTFQVLTGAVPFGKSVGEIQEKQAHPAPNPSAMECGVPVELDSPILGLLQKDPDARGPSASAAVREMEEAWLRAEQRKWREHELPKRYVYALAAGAVAILIAAGLYYWPVIRNLENRTVDARFGMGPRRAPDPHLLMVALDDNALADDPRPIAQWDGKFAILVERILDGGARSVALDFLAPASWSESRPFARLIGLHPDRLAIAVFSETGKLTGTECVGPLTALMIGAERYPALFGLANLVEDEDRRIRRERTAFSDREGKIRPSLAARAVDSASLAPAGFTLRDRAEFIDYSVSPSNIPKLAWKDAGERPPEFFKDKIVMIGADYSGSNDRHRIPAAVDPGWVSGLAIHALIANTIIRDFPVTDPGPAACLGIMSLACFGTLALALRFPHRLSLAIAFSAVLFTGYAAVAFAVFRASRAMLVVVAPEIALLLSLIIAWRLRSMLTPYPMKGA